MSQEFYFERSLNSITLNKKLKENKFYSILLLTGKKSYFDSGIKKYVEKSLTSNFTIYLFNDFTSNPNVDDLKKGLKYIDGNKIDVILCCGGGSVIDFGKCLSFFAKQMFSPEEYLSSNNGLKPQNMIIPIIAIPTTAGSGSEATHFAVLYWNKVKYSIASSMLLPKIVIINSLFSLSLTPYQTACTGMDALCQAIESYWSINSTLLSRNYSKSAIKIIFSSLDSAVNSPNIHNHEAMTRGAYLAGKAINIAKTTGPHAISYSLTSIYNIPHGHAVSLTIADFMTFNDNITKTNCNDMRGVEFVKTINKEIATALGSGSLKSASVNILDLIRRINLNLSFKNLGIKKEGLKFILDNVNIQRLQNNPKKINTIDIKKHLESHL